MEIVNNRLVPNPMEPRAALGDYDTAEDHFTLWTTSQNPHVARLVLSAFYNVAPENKLRVIAPDVGGGFGSKIYIYPEEIVCLWASKRTGRSGEVEFGPHRSLPDRRPWPRPRHDRQDGVRRRQQDHRLQGRHHRQSGRLHVAVLVLGADLSLCDRCCRASTTSRRSMPMCTVYTNTTPVDAYRGAGRPEATYLWSG
jgi:carbon-monoxide dehydrogenase large subunit